MKTTFLNFATALVLTSALIQTANAKAGDYNVITEAKKYIQNPRVEVECQGYGYDSYDINYFSYAILNEVELYGDPKKPLPVLGINRLLVVSQFNQKTGKTQKFHVENIELLEDAPLSDKATGDSFTKRFEVAVLQSKSFKITVSKTQDLYSSVYCKVESLNPKFKDLAEDEADGYFSPWNGKL